MKFEYLEPRAEVRFLLSGDIIATSTEEGGNNKPGISPETQPKDDAVEDPF